MDAYTTSRYVERYLKPKELRQNIARVVKYIRQNNLIDAFDTIAFRGMSGALVAPTVALRLRKELIMVRKGEPSHARYEVEGNAAAKRVLIVDDFVSTGDTVREITKGVRNITKGAASIIGCVEYRNLNGEYPEYRANNGYLYQQ